MRATNSLSSKPKKKKKVSPKRGKIGPKVKRVNEKYYTTMAYFHVPTRRILLLDRLLKMFPDIRHRWVRVNKRGCMDSFDIGIGSFCESMDHLVHIGILEKRKGPWATAPCDYRIRPGILHGSLEYTTGCWRSSSTISFKEKSWVAGHRG